MARPKTPPNQKRTLQAYINWTQLYDWKIEFSPNFLPDISRERARKMLKQFWEQVEVREFGHKRNGQSKAKIKRMCFIEGDGQNLQVHYHCAVQLPPLHSKIESAEERAQRLVRFCARLKMAWEQSQAAGHHTTCEPIKSFEGFTVYICKKSLSDSFCGMTSEL